MATIYIVSNNTSENIYKIGITQTTLTTRLYTLNTGQINKFKKVKEYTNINPTLLRKIEKSIFKKLKAYNIDHELFKADINIITHAIEPIIKKMNVVSDNKLPAEKQNTINFFSQKTLADKIGIGTETLRLRARAYGITLANHHISKTEFEQLSTSQNKFKNDHIGKNASLSSLRSISDPILRSIAIAHAYGDIHLDELPPMMRSKTKHILKSAHIVIFRTSNSGTQRILSYDQFIKKSDGIKFYTSGAKITSRRDITRDP